MRPLRLLLSLASSLIALTIILYVGFGSSDNEPPVATSAAPSKPSKLKAFFSFTSPASFFPPSAVISLTDDNSTFFLARPAAFGPMLPSKGLSGPLWVGNGFGDDTMGRGELGCSDVPGWSDDGHNALPGSKLALDPKRKSLLDTGVVDSGQNAVHSKRAQKGGATKDKENSKVDDGTDDYLHHPLPASEMPKPPGLGANGKTSEHADIQSLQEGAEIAGKVVLLKRGGCGFLEKVKWAQRRGGIALIVGDDVRGGALVSMYAHGDTSNITIPAIFTSYTTAHLLSSLLPTGGLLEDLSPEDAAKLGIVRGKSPKGGSNSKEASGKARKPRPTSTRLASRPTRTPKSGKQREKNESGATGDSNGSGWFRSFWSIFGIGSPRRAPTKGDSRRPPSSGNIDWVLVKDWDEDRSKQTRIQTKAATKPTNPRKPAPTPAPDDFVIGEQDWRDPDLLPQRTSTVLQPDNSKQKQEVETTPLKGGSILPGSGEYSKEGGVKSEGRHAESADDHKEHSGWFGSLLGDDAMDEETEFTSSRDRKEESENEAKKSNGLFGSKGDEDGPDHPPQHEGLWVTLTPTNMSTSPFFDTLLVLVVSPLITLTVVYALLLLRSRIRRRRWRAPKSVVERLPVRTYHTISDTSPVATPASSSPTTPLLHHPHSQPRATSSSASRPRSRTTSEVPATSSSFQGTARSPEEEKREAGLAEWRRRYGGRQKECVVCLEEYVDGVSRVMSLPCGHEFHADCITPWLVTRRRTCPICKGDVVRSLSRAHHFRNERSESPFPSSSQPYSADSEAVQAQAAETRNDSPSAARPIDEDFDADVEANWLHEPSEEDGDSRGNEASGSGDRMAVDLGAPLREISASLRQGLGALRRAAGWDGRNSQEQMDRDR